MYNHDINLIKETRDNVFKTVDDSLKSMSNFMSIINISVNYQISKA
jgi:hypothetical protein